MRGNNGALARSVSELAIVAEEASGLVTSVGQVPAERLRTIFDGMFDGVWLVSDDGTTTYANAAMAELLGTSAAEMRGRAVSEFLEPDAWSAMTSFLQRQRIHESERMEVRFRRVDDGDLFAIVAGSPITTQDGAYVGTMLNVSDVTGKRSIDAQVVQNQRLEAIGQFAGGIAHDFNNLLTAIQGYTQMAIDALPGDDPIRMDLAQVVASTERATAITRQLLAFTRRQVLMPVDVDPAIVVAGLLPILAPLLGEVVIAVDVNANHAWVRVDPTQLEQIIMNLALNARDAMPEGGTVTISLHNLEGADPDRPDPDLTAGPFVRISVADTGIGMDETTKARIFDPFYTTKLDGQGTGFGLSTVFGIVAQSGGQVQVESTLGHGSTFHIDLPRVVGRSRAVKPSRDEPLRQGSGAILLAEDDPAVRLFARRSLESAGYTVFAAAGAEDAIKASEHWSAAIEVLVTDIVMPGMHGHELAALIRETRPGIGIVLMSGYTDDALGRDTELGVVEFLNKPFTAAALSRAVGQAIDAASGNASAPRPDTADH
ncbi:MAG: two-component system, cell cycle sensor histidine kinase and response regulator CckA [Chloroflexota bacterium]|jgi:two-component system cell cycle sensor histidine kinase/response regulator CckA|nr:two-component system, cell cycle sensor histidine kinase and response regulator CckA [Chloroflexota bacterium]